jgi:hypothetical protein
MNIIFQFYNQTMLLTNFNIINFLKLIIHWNYVHTDNNNTYMYISNSTFPKAVQSNNTRKYICTGNATSTCFSTLVLKFSLAQIYWECRYTHQNQGTNAINFGLDHFPLLSWFLMTCSRIFFPSTGFWGSILRISFGSNLHVHKK